MSTHQTLLFSTKEDYQQAINWSHRTIEVTSPKGLLNRAFLFQIISLVLFLGVILSTYYCCKIHHVSFCAIPLGIGSTAIISLLAAALCCHILAYQGNKKMDDSFMQFKAIKQLNTLDLVEVKKANLNLGPLVRMGLLTIAEVEKIQGFIQSMEKDYADLEKAKKTLEGYKKWENENTEAWKELQNSPQNYPNYGAVKETNERLTKKINESKEWSQFQNELKIKLLERSNVLEKGKEEPLSLISSFALSDAKSWRDSEVETNFTAIKITLISVALIFLIGVIVSTYFCFNTGYFYQSTYVSYGQLSMLPLMFGSFIIGGLLISALLVHFQERFRRKQEMEKMGSAEKDAIYISLKTKELKDLKNALFKEKANFGPLVRTEVLTIEEAEKIKILISDYQKTAKTMDKCHFVFSNENKNEEKLPLEYPFYQRMQKRLNELNEAWKACQKQITDRLDGIKLTKSINSQ